MKWDTLVILFLLFIVVPILSILSIVYYFKYKDEERKKDD